MTSFNKILFQKCCYCVPSRIGILIWAYANMLGVLPPFSYYGYVALLSIAFYGLDSIIASTLTVFLMLSLELAFILLLIVAAHKENIKLHKIFFYYSIISTPIETALFIWYTRCCDEFYSPDLTTVKIILIIIFAVLKMYITFIIKFEINKLKNKYNIELEDYGNDVQCALNMTQEKEKFGRKDNSVILD